MTRSLSLSLSVCLFSGRRVGGQTALEMGLVNRAVEQNQTGDAAYREALTLAREILPQVRMQTHTIPLCHSSDTDASPPTPSPAGQGPGLPPHFSSAFLSASLHSAFLPSWCFLPPPPISLPLLFPLFRPLSLRISFTPVQMAAVGRARVAVKWRNGPQIAAHTYKRHMLAML